MKTKNTTNTDVSLRHHNDVNPISKSVNAPVKRTTEFTPGFFVGYPFFDHLSDNSAMYTEHGNDFADDEANTQPQEIKKETVTTVNLSMPGPRGATLKAEDY